MNRDLPQQSLPHGKRKFYNIVSSDFERQPDTEKQCDVIKRDSNIASTEEYQLKSGDVSHSGKDLLQYIQDNVIGRDKEFVGPFGRRKVEYCDYTASGRSLSFIEDYIRDHVLSDYGNTHTTTSVCSLQTTLFRHEARDIIRNAVNASEHDSVLFESSGCTGAIHKLIHALDLTQPPIILVSPFEHHSNLLPWREMGSRVIRVRETADGQMDMKHLEHLLETVQGEGQQVIGAFAAASNITGILVDVNLVTGLCHRYNTLAIWDYATAAPYVHIDMNPVISGINPDLVSKDAVFISTHKFVGGVQTPGILIAKKKLFRNSVPFVPGGGTVFFVRREAQRYLQEVEMREEGGTPAIVESIRAGLVFQLKEAVSSNIIHDREKQLVSSALDHWKNCGSLKLLGSQTAPRLAVFSFLVLHAESGVYLHHNYICVLLNDLFGIQARGGCACAGPYAEDLLGIDENLAKQYEELLVEDTQLDRTHLRRYREYSHREILRPGFARLNLPYFLDNNTVQFILEAVRLVAEHGWKLLPQYNFNPETGEWRHKNHQVFRDRAWLGHINYNTGCMTRRVNDNSKWIEKTKESPKGHEDCLRQACDLFDQSAKFRCHLPDQTLMFDEEAKRLRWFLLPSEAMEWLQNAPKIGGDSKSAPFQVVTYPRNLTGMIEDMSWEPTRNIAALNNVVDKEFVDAVAGCSSVPFKEGMACVLNDGYSGGSQEHIPSLDRNKLVDNYPEDDSNETTRDANNHKTPIDSPINLNIVENTNNLDAGTTLNKSPEVCEDVHEAPDTCFMTTPSVEQTVSHDYNRPTIPDVAAPSDDLQNSPIVTCKLINTRNTTLETTGHQWHPPPKTIFKPFVQALEEYSMIENGDRVLACLSGGKDSLSMLHSLHQYQYYSKKKGIVFKLGAVTIDPQTSSYDPSPLKDYLQELDVPYFYEEQCILDTAQSLPYECASICSFCSRMKRGRIYHAARRERYNVLALGQHLDDLAESFLMSVFHNGNLRTMKACYTVEEGDLRVIRPFVYIRETELRKFAEQNKLPVIAENCPACFEAPKERHRIKQLLAAQEILHPRLFPSILSAMKPILGISQTGINIRSIVKQLGVGQEENESNDIDNI